MIQAAFDTSSNNASFALYKDGQQLISVSKECHRGASKLLPWIHELIKQESIAISQIDEWFVGKGPGSFTGLRVGISFVKGVCFASGSKYMGVNSGYAYLKGVQAEPGEHVTILHDGRKQEVICNSFEATGNGWLETGTKVLRIEDLPQRDNPGRMFTLMDVDLFPEECRSEIRHVPKVDASALIKCGLEFSATDQGMDESCEPVYVRPAVFIDPIKLKRKNA